MMAESTGQKPLPYCQDTYKRIWLIAIYGGGVF